MVFVTHGRRGDAHAVVVERTDEADLNTSSSVIAFSVNHVMRARRLVPSTSLRIFQAVGAAGLETAPPANMPCTSVVENPSSDNTSALCSPRAGAREGATFSCVAI